MDKKEFKAGYHWCHVCHNYTFHDWCIPVDIQFFETCPDNTPIPDEVFVCLRCNDTEGYDESNYDGAYEPGN
ncbi:hypothetical protein DSM106972_016130 [Dulcicalothrix desertica PCC 7102]|uniref:Uncharacterized protein n=1 Tax=Dulcicalothrix desertica PCC 7102 TaxID=232991 RepID=A0A3S1J663_9CYAN|nr:hypothetical protein [Dulcicalothrix desertica]RUT08445.1 hypothetical protein DSM106972_016130 [Dulcicalothrix desertica PCC 7102]TWH40309.1 hypothetical protein CAL7102_09617 [Dulcicalothrix desertica PCC 7102]